MKNWSKWYLSSTSEHNTKPPDKVKHRVFLLRLSHTHICHNSPVKSEAELFVNVDAPLTMPGVFPLITLFCYRNRAKWGPSQFCESDGLIRRQHNGLGGGGWGVRGQWGVRSKRARGEWGDQCSEGLGARWLTRSEEWGTRWSSEEQGGPVREWGTRCSSEEWGKGGPVRSEEQGGQVRSEETEWGSCVEWIVPKYLKMASGVCSMPGGRSRRTGARRWSLRRLFYTNPLLSPPFAR